MTPHRILLFTCGQPGMMILARFLMQWIIDFAATPQPDNADLTLFSAALVGTVFLGYRIFDGVTDPVAGVVSDRWAARGKARQNLLWFAFFLPALGVVLTFAPQHSMAVSLRWTLLISGLFVFFVGYTFYAIPYWSLVEDYAQGASDTRRVLSNQLGVGLLIATGIGFVISPMVIEAYGFSLAAILFAVPSLLLMLGPIFAAPPAQSNAHVERRDDAPSPLQSLKIALKDRRFVAILVLFAGSQMSLTIMTAAAPFIARDLLDGSIGDVALLMGPLLGVALPSFAFTPALSRRLGWERAILFASLALGVVYTTTAGLGEAWIGTPMVTAMVLFALGGPMIAVLLGLEGEAITASAEASGSDAVSIYFGVYNFIVKALNGVALALAGILADLSAPDQLGLFAVRLMGGIAGVCLFICAGIYFLIRPRRGSTTTPQAQTQ